MVARFLEFGDSSVKPFQWKKPRLDFVLLFEFAQEPFKGRCVEAEVKGENVRVGETKCDQTPNASRGDEVFGRRIIDVRHPIMIVVHRVIHAVVAGTSEIDNRPTEMIQKHSMIGAAADARIYQRA